MIAVNIRNKMCLDDFYSTVKLNSHRWSYLIPPDINNIGKRLPEYPFFSPEVNLISKLLHFYV
jgi:hypothetical protein